MSLVRSGWLVVLLATAAVVAACSGGSSGDALTGRRNATSDPDAATSGSDPNGANPGGETGGINSSGVGAGTGAPTGLRCDVQQLLENRCIGCHQNASPPKLLTYEDLLKPAPSDAKKNLAQVSLERMKNAASPMPPKPAVAPTPAEIALMEAWIAAGTSKGAACTTPPPGNDGGVGGGAGGPYDTPPVCTSNKAWKNGNEGSSSMRPGGACITCHSQQGGPGFNIAGTVYPTAHEPDDCNGVPGQMSVVVTDANNKVTTIPVNNVGNFSSGANIAPPFKVKIVRGAAERAMGGTLTAGDCNTCHTQTGVNGAPGRVMAP
jgi:mono/diheme cytochrome c family protein